MDPEIQKDQKPRPHPQKGIALDLALTSRRPLRCRYCSVEKAPYPELPAREGRGIVESLARLRKIELISLEGGEPFLRSDLSLFSRRPLPWLLDRSEMRDGEVLGCGRLSSPL